MYRSISTREALELSIKHWENNVAAKIPNAVGLGSDSCALCVKFQDYGDCTTCPVRTFSGERSCRNTPYRSAVDAHRIWECNLDYDILGDFRKAFRVAAQKELDFLIGLRNGVFPDEVEEASGGTSSTETNHTSVEESSSRFEGGSEGPSDI
jgi:hypothetical protein